MTPRAKGNNGHLPVNAALKDGPERNAPPAASPPTDRMPWIDGWEMLEGGGRRRQSFFSPYISRNAKQKCPRSTSSLPYAVRKLCRYMLNKHQQEQSNASLQTKNNKYFRGIFRSCQDPSATTTRDIVMIDRVPPSQPGCRQGFRT